MHKKYFKQKAQKLFLTKKEKKKRKKRWEGGGEKKKKLKENKEGIKTEFFIKVCMFKNFN